MIGFDLLFPRLPVNRCLFLHHFFFLPVHHHQLVELIVLLTQVGFAFYFPAVDVLFFLLLRLHLFDDVVVLRLHLLLKELVELVLGGHDAFDIILDVLLRYGEQDLLLLLKVRLVGSCNLSRWLAEILDLRLRRRGHSGALVVPLLLPLVLGIVGEVESCISVHLWLVLDLRPSKGGVEPLRPVLFGSHWRLVGRLSLRGRDHPHGGGLELHRRWLHRVRLRLSSIIAV